MARLDTLLSGSLAFRDNGVETVTLVPNNTELQVTGSLNIKGPHLRFAGTDIGVRLATVEAATGETPLILGGLTVWSASLNNFTQSIADATSSYAVTSSNYFTGSQYFSGSLIPQATPSGNGLHDLGSATNPWKDLYITTASLNFVRNGSIVSTISGEDEGIRVGNILITTSSIGVVNDSGIVIDTVYEAKISSSGELEEVGKQSLPLGIVSSSAQIADLQFLSSSIQGIISRSAQISELGFVTASRYDEILEIPSGIISSSAQIATGNELSGSSIIGSDLLNLHSITGSVNLTGSLSLDNSDLEVTGSFDLNLNGVSDYFQINIDGEEAVKVNNEGVLQLFSQSSAPTPVEGGMYFGNDYNLYLGVNE